MRASVRRRWVSSSPPARSDGYAPALRNPNPQRQRPLMIEHVFDRMRHARRPLPHQPPQAADEASARQLLDCATAALRTRRLAEVAELELAIQWAVVHGHPREDRDPMVTPGGDGTPAVREHAIPELAMARETHPATTRALIADGLDLVHRLPLTWQVVEAGGCEPWVARKVAVLSRALLVRPGRAGRPRRGQGHRRARTLDRARDRPREDHRGRPRDPPRRTRTLPPRALRLTLPRRRVRLPPPHRPRHRRRRRLDRRHGRPRRRHPRHHDGPRPQPRRAPIPRHRLARPTGRPPQAPPRAHPARHRRRP